MDEVSIVGVDLAKHVFQVHGATGDAGVLLTERLGHDARLIPPTYVKPFVKRQKNDVADAEAIVEATMRPTMRIGPVKSPDQQARAMFFRTRELLVGQRTQLANALRAHPAEHGVIVPKGPGATSSASLPLSARTVIAWRAWFAI